MSEKISDMILIETYGLTKDSAGNMETELVYMNALSARVDLEKGVVNRLYMWLNSENVDISYIGLALGIELPESKDSVCTDLTALTLFKKYAVFICKILIIVDGEPLLISFAFKVRDVALDYSLSFKNGKTRLVLNSWVNKVINFYVNPYYTVQGYDLLTNNEWINVYLNHGYSALKAFESVEVLKRYADKFSKV